ncbi:chemotaxis protein methyltransferase [Thermodesulfomicrobium sp. WS]|uniref:CheR family methyltransferase n=1 Tax=Thermodesulfomicrobium sp. WS TaxID=3004129 RepID=UPI0024920D7B|nr:protein-glutamate O-methyltransferase CheR [Thermodesulfomicrobium sp. WS]BDV02083.1 chemotaxis protein methyltransferase [Thermodesulfomicrobium sp. WS]
MSSLFSKTITLERETRIDDEAFRNLRDFIYEQSGIYIGDNRKYLLENRLANRLRELNLKNFNEYYYFLKFDPDRKKELSKLFEVITTNETSFFRNPPQIAVFQEKVLPEILESQRATRSVLIWSAGCSTGEEPYTLAIVCHEVLGSEIASWNIRITANDLSDAVLHAAKRGIYSEYSLRTTPPDVVAKYFHSEGGGRFRIREEVQRLVHFGQINLSDRLQVRRVERSQVIFCRNVIIYFDDNMKRQVLSGFYDNLLPGGYLFLGHSESVHNLSRAFRPVQHPGCIIYQKERTP